MESQHVELLESIFNNLPQIESFTLVFPSSGGTFDNGWEGSADFYDMEVVNSSISFFKKALSSPAFSHLTDLRLHLPCTHNVGQICEGLGQDTHNQILHLEICIVDASGVSGQREHLFFDNPGDYMELDGDVHIYNSVPYSNMQREFSNQEHQDELWKFVGSCPNLQSLHIVGSNFLDLDRLHWKKAPDSRGLRVLSLERVWVSSSSLEALLLASPSVAQTTPQLRRICLGDVKLHDDGGNWEDIFNSLREGYPELELSYMQQLTYFESHPRYASLQSPWNSSWKIQSEEESELRAMYALAEHLAERAGGWDYYPQECHESIDDYGLDED
uniref:F-box domain-containing protein n=1 Tax=Bionectria ochroleuca TaxID=29856 RepID=A0A8H7K4G9_BIOOC